MAGDGARKLLGAPPLTPLQAVIRESGQNSWDARRGASCVRFEVRLRSLTPSEATVLREQVFAELPVPPASRDSLRGFLDGRHQLVLEVSDFGTVGLGGPTRADVAPAAGQSPRFVNFVRNIGVARNTPQGGGTYGFGKTSFYKASGCSTIIVDSLATNGAEPERRLIACHLGGEFADTNARKFTGRHWWGAPSDEDDFVEPLIGSAAAGLAQALGLPARGADDTGTTVAVLMPQVDSVDAAIAEIREALLWFFWPKMVAIDGEPAAMEFALVAEGSEVSIPPPETFPPLDLYVEAFLEVKRKTAASRVVMCGNPIKQLGRMAISRGFRGDRRMLAQDSLVPQTSFHVALMRPVELVVRYLEGRELGQGSHEWAGVFICSDEEEVERAFAASEPPAHDDWCPTNLEDRRPKMFVNVALRRIREIAGQIIYPRLNPAGSAPDQPPLAKAASRLGGLAPLQPDDQTAGSGRTLRGTRRRWTVQPARYISIKDVEQGVEALFQVVALNSSSAPLRITATPGLVIDDRVSGEVELPDGGTISIRAWERPDGSVLSSGNVVEVGPGETADMRVRVRIPGFGGAVGVLLNVED
jgi:hypothetical protein